MVAPSLEMVAWPLAETMSLSIPRGPSVEEMVPATARQAAMLERSWGVPCEVSVPSARCGVRGSARGARGGVRARYLGGRRQWGSVGGRVSARFAFSQQAEYVHPCRAFGLPFLERERLEERLREGCGRGWKEELGCWVSA